MSPTPEVSERQRKAAFKAWDTMRRKEAENGDGATKKSNRSTAKKKTSDYPENWKQIVAEVRNRARNADGQEQCECCGECKKHRGRCEEINGTQAKHAKGKIILTTAHLCHETKCARRKHLRSMCQLCHLLYDVELHARHRRERREREIGQERLFAR
jgi:hypothetical protein